MSYQIEIRHIKYFLAVAEDLHFRKAAERLFISQPGLSKQIKQMENDLGVVLFERHNRKVLLTRAGEYLKKELAINLKNLEHTLNHAKMLNDGKNGDLKFGYVGSAMQEIIPNLLMNFKSDYPNIVFSLKEMDNEKQIEELLSYDLDLGFVRLDRVPRGLISKPVLKESFCLVLPENHLVNADNFKSLTQFKQESFILFDPKYSSSYYEKVMQLFDESGFSPIVSHNTIHAGSIYKLVENNFGISIVPKSLVTQNNQKIKFIELKKTKQKTTLSVVWNIDNRNPILKEIVKLL
ncbi:HTH-type transcriptional regulator TfdS [Polaribacter huanghezhanensis]|uniref:LysR family transcriptional regulator n=1 Tax=Polaribacter huanghezhanensis TaxID=1354726 RepID=UPI002648EF84|nr:LysR family transcriptional regulator [Polaribacter huanghezhanensis]WKD86013.1 HTH-type transcriptional regulator TfdS [Polaribacter huanghezhanensis]